MTAPTRYHIPEWASSIVRRALEAIGQPDRIAAHETFLAALRVAQADGPGPHPFTAPESAAQVPQ